MWYHMVICPKDGCLLRLLLHYPLPPLLNRFFQQCIKLLCVLNVESMTCQWNLQKLSFWHVLLDPLAVVGINKVILIPRHDHDFWNGSRYLAQSRSSNPMSECCRHLEQCPKRALNLSYRMTVEIYLDPKLKFKLVVHRCRLTTFCASLFVRPSGSSSAFASSHSAGNNISNEIAILASSSCTKNSLKRRKSQIIK
jgi:hypothetical protein